MDYIVQENISHESHSYQDTALQNQKAIPSEAIQFLCFLKQWVLLGCIEASIWVKVMVIRVIVSVTLWFVRCPILTSVAISSMKQKIGKWIQGAQFGWSQLTMSKLGHWLGFRHVVQQLFFFFAESMTSIPVPGAGLELLCNFLWLHVLTHFFVETSSNPKIFLQWFSSLEPTAVERFSFVVNLTLFLLTCAHYVVKIKVHVLFFHPWKGPLYLKAKLADDCPLSITETKSFGTITWRWIGLSAVSMPLEIITLFC